MAKQDLQESQRRYDDCMKQARAAEAAADFDAAIQHAMSAWEFVEDMMKYERKYEEAEFKSVPCVDMVLKYAPIMLNHEALDALQAFLKERKSVDKHASDDLAWDLACARHEMAEASRLWTFLEAAPMTPQRDLRQRLGGTQEVWRSILERWEKAGTAVRVTSGTDTLVRLKTNLNAPTPALCPTCGCRATAPKLEHLNERLCESCGRNAWFVLQTEVIDEMEIGTC